MDYTPGRNLLRNTGQITTHLKNVNNGWVDGGTWKFNSGGNGTLVDCDDPLPNVGDGWSIINNTTGNRDVSQGSFPFVTGETYTLSFYARNNASATGNSKLLLRSWNTTQNKQNPSSISPNVTSSEWTKFTWTFVCTWDDTEQHSIAVGVQGASSVDFCGVKLEYGSTATDWSPAPEDAQNEPTWNYNILARNSTSLSQIRDISAVYRFYKLQSSTSSPPAKPTTADIPPSGWSMTEPSYTAGSTNSLYSVELTIFTDDTFSYSEVSLSSSYEAAKQAYNKATATQNALDDYINPVASKSWTGVIAPANNDPNGWLYWGFIRPTSYYLPWRITYQIRAKVNGVSDGYQSSTVTIDGQKNTYYAYQAYNIIPNSNYRAYYAHVLYTCKEAGLNNGYGHLLGTRLQSSYDPVTASHARDVDIDILETENCTFEFADTWFLYANAPGTGSTNYNTRYSFDGTTNGFTESGDRNETNHVLNNFCGKTGVLGIWQTGLFMEDADGFYQNICTDSAGAVTRTNATTKKANPNGFKIGSQIYFAPNNSYASNTNITGATYASYGALDSRYSINSTLTANFLTPYVPIYLVGTILEGAFYLDPVWWTQTPNDPSKVYVHIGACYDSNTTNCRITLTEPNRWYKYVDGKLVDYSNRLAEIAQQTADSALTTADGKNTVFYQTSAPATSGRKTNDIWFDTDDGNKMYYFNGSSWAERQFGQNAIAADSIYARHVVSGAITAAKISVDNLAAISANLGAITGGSLNIGNGTFTVSPAGALKATSADVSGKITASDGQIADWIIVKNDANRGTSAQGGHIYNTSLYSHSSNSEYEFEVGLKNDGGVGTLAYYVKRIPLNAAWTSANVTDIFYIRTDGKVYCANLEVDNPTFKVTNTYLEFGDIANSKYFSVTKDNVFMYDNQGHSTSINAQWFLADDGGGSTKLTSSKLDFLSLSVSQGSLRYNSGSGAFGLYSDVQSQWMISMSASNNVWVGSSDSTNLPGKIIFGNTIDKIYVFNASGGTTLIKTAVSDRRLKHDICDLSSSKEFIMGLRAKKFKMNGEEGDRYHFGFVAQDVRPLLESTVGDGVLIEYNPEDIDTEFYDKDDERTFSYSMDYTQFIAPMVSVIQEQERTIRALSDELTDIREMLAVLIDRG